MPLPTKIKKPAGNPASSPFEFHIEVNYEPPTGPPNTTHATVQGSWTASNLEYVADSSNPRGTVDAGAGTITWTNVVITAGTVSQFELELGCIAGGTGLPTLNAQSTDLDNGGTSNAASKSFNCPT